MLRRFAPALAGLAFALAAPVALAQANKDTVRLAVYQPVPIGLRPKSLLFSSAR